MSPARRGVWKRCVGAGGTGWGRCAAAAGVLGVAGGLGLRALGVRRPSSLWMAGRAGTCRGGTLPAARARAAGRRGSWSRGPGPSPRHGPRRGPRGRHSRERVGPPTAGSSARGEGAETAAREGPAVGAMSGPATGGGRVVEGQPATGAALRARGAAETAAAAAGGRPRPHRAGGATGGVGARGPGGQRRGRRSATTPPRGRGDQAVAGASAVPRVLARSTAEPSRTLADSGDCISGTARNRRPTPSYSASIVGS